MLESVKSSPDKGAQRFDATPAAPAQLGSDSRRATVLDRFAEKRIAEFLEPADIRINGRRPWDLQVYDPRFYMRVISMGSLGAGESYMDGWWDVEALDEFFARLHLADPYRNLGHWRTVLLAFRSSILNRQTLSRSRRVSREHYDLGNDIYQAMLGRRMQYTCGYWRHAGNLDEAQEEKLHLICRKLHLQPGMRVLDLGCGFGGLSHFMATEYGCCVVSYNISREQVAYGRHLCRGLPVRFEEKDYRCAADEDQRFDRVVAIGLCEHVGYKNYPGFLDLVHGRLARGGLFLLHTIGSNETVTSTDEWIDRYIFPNGMLPSLAQLGRAMERGWIMEDWHNFGPDYDRTLLAWNASFERAWPTLRAKYGERLRRMWRYYLLSSAGGFRARKMQLWQIVLSKGDVRSYVPAR